ncbi:S8/S53 family peptidase [Clostridia bacterium]|nr:S8/S53 family peptidase [Clostridia bacterium]
MDKELLFHGIKRLDEMGYKGQKVNVLIFEVPGTDHASRVEASLRYMAPEVNVYHAWYNLRNFKLIEMVQYIVEKEIHIINISLSAEGYPSEFVQMLEDFIERGLLVFCAAGNDRDKGPFGLAMDVAITIGAASLIEEEVCKRDDSSAITSYLDFIFLRPPDHIAGHGTSFASPMAAGLAARLLSGYGRIEQQEMIEVFRVLSQHHSKLLRDDAENSSVIKSRYTGWGAPIFKQELVEELLDR